MRQTKVWTGLATLGLAAALGLGTGEAQTAPGPERGGDRPAAARGGPPAGRPMAGPAPLRMEAPRREISGARIEQRVRSGTTDLRQRTLRPDRTIAGATISAPPLTVTRDGRYATRYYGTRYTGERDYYIRRRSDAGWFPSLLAAPFLLPWYIAGGGYDYDYDYAPSYYDPYEYEPSYGPTYVTGPVGYPGPASTFGPAFGNYCATPQKTCQLYEPAEVGLGCSCRAPAGLPRFRGAVVP